MIDVQTAGHSKTWSCPKILGYINISKILNKKQIQNLVKTCDILEKEEWIWKLLNEFLCDLLSVSLKSVYIPL